MNITEEHSWSGQRLIVTWHDASFDPPRNLVTQASGICFTDDNRIVLVTTDGKTWHLPGGHPEEDEITEEAFIREVKDWALSRKRYWGTPLPIWTCTDKNVNMKYVLEVLKNSGI